MLRRKLGVRRRSLAELENSTEVLGDSLELLVVFARHQLLLSRYVVVLWVSWCGMWWWSEWKQENKPELEARSRNHILSTPATTAACSIPCKHAFTPVVDLFESLFIKRRPQSWCKKLNALARISGRVAQVEKARPPT